MQKIRFPVEEMLVERKRIEGIFNVAKRLFGKFVAIFAID